MKASVKEYMRNSRKQSVIGIPVPPEGAKGIHECAAQHRSIWRVGESTQHFMSIFHCHLNQDLRVLKHFCSMSHLSLFLFHFPISPWHSKTHHEITIGHRIFLFYFFERKSCYPNWFTNNNITKAGLRRPYKLLPCLKHNTISMKFHTVRIPSSIAILRQGNY